MRQPMYTLDDIAGLRAAGAFPDLLPADLAVRHLAAVYLDGNASARLSHGQSVAAGDAGVSGRVRLYDDAGALSWHRRGGRAGPGASAAVVCLVAGPAPQVEFRGCNGSKDQDSGITLMTLSSEKKDGILEQFRRGPRDTGSPEVQVALLSERINGLSDHFSAHKGDHPRGAVWSNSSTSAASFSTI